MSLVNRSGDCFGAIRLRRTRNDGVNMDFSETSGMGSDKFFVLDISKHF